jgi:hypothetical protein
LFTCAGKAELNAAVMSPAMQWQRAHWWQLLESLDQQVLETMTWLKAASQNDVAITRLRTHPGIGLLTSLCLVHTLQPVARFRNPRKVAAYAGFDPMEPLPQSANSSWGSAKPVPACCVTCWSKPPTSPSEKTKT